MGKVGWRSVSLYISDCEKTQSEDWDLLDNLT